MLLKKINDTTYKREIKADIKDELNVVIGDDKQPDFKPQMKIERWGNLDGTNECNVSIRLKESKDELKETAVITEEEGIIKYKKSKKEVNFYDIAPCGEHPEGASEFEVIEYEPSGLDYVDFTIDCKDAEFFKQLEITQEEKDNGASQPDNVINSLAIYAKTSKTNWTGGKEYKVGKIGHIFRDKVIDAVGNWAWTDPEFIPNEDGVTGILRVHRPAEFLATCVYPVRHAAGLTFGYTTKGAAALSHGNYDWMAGSIFTITETATADSITAYAAKAPDYSTAEFCGVIYNSDSSLVGKTDEVSFGGAYDNSWRTFNFSGTKPSLVANTAYILECAWCRYMFAALYYDSGAANQGYGQRITWSPGGNWTALNPAVFTETSTNKFSIYATYTAGGGASGPANLKSRSGNLKANIKSISGNLIANCKSLSGNA